MKNNSPKKNPHALFQPKSEGWWQAVNEGIVLLMFFISILFILVMFNSCTVSVNMTNSHGKAEDIIDTHQKADGDLSPTLSIPASL